VESVPGKNNAAIIPALADDFEGDFFKAIVEEIKIQLKAMAKRWCFGWMF